MRLSSRKFCGVQKFYYSCVEGEKISAEQEVCRSRHKLFKKLLDNLAAQPRVVNHFIESRQNRPDHAGEGYRCVDHLPNKHVYERLLMATVGWAIAVDMVARWD